MPLILVLALMILLKYFEVGFVEKMSWWWVVGVAVVGFIWFEFIERMLGLDKRRAFDESDKARADRVKKNFQKK